MAKGGRQNPFTIYKNEVTRLLFVLGLKHRAVEFEQTEIPAYEDSMIQARFACDQEGQWVCFVFNSCWGRTKPAVSEVKRIALHEVLHYLLDDLIQLSLKRSATMEDIRREEHRIINRVINASFGRI